MFCQWLSPWREKCSTCRRSRNPGSQGRFGTRWPCNLIKPTRFQMRKMCFSFLLHFFSIIIKRLKILVLPLSVCWETHDMSDWKKRSLIPCLFFSIFRDRHNLVSPSSSPLTSRATGLKKNSLSFRLNITSEFDIFVATRPPFWPRFLKRSFSKKKFYFFTIPSLKMECEKLASEKIEIQRHYVMV